MKSIWLFISLKNDDLKKIRKKDILNKYAQINLAAWSDRTYLRLERLLKNDCHFSTTSFHANRHR